MNKTWRKVKLGDIVSFQTGKLDSNAAEPNGTFPFFTCSQETYKTNTYSFDGEYVLLGGNNASGVFPLKYFFGKFDAYQRTYVLKTLNKQQLMNKFLYYQLKIKLELLQSMSTGATTKFLTMHILNNLNVYLPPIETQRRIADILSAYDDLIENNTRRIKILENMAQAIYREWFVKFRFPGYGKVEMIDSPLGKIPEGWEVKKLGEVLTLEYGKALKEDVRKGGRFPVYGSSGIVGYHDNALAKGPGIIVGRKGNVGALYWSDDDFFPIDTAYYIKTDLSLFYLFFNLKFQNFINNDAAVPGLNRNQAYLLPIIKPDQKLLKEFDSVIKEKFSLMRKLQDRNTNLRFTRDLLLPKLVGGEVEG